MPVVVGGARSGRRHRRARRRRRPWCRRARRGGARGVAGPRGEGARQAREAAGGRAVLRARRVRGPMSEIAHLGPAELFTPQGRREPARSSSTSSGWRSRPQDGPSTYLRGWGDYQRWSLKLISRHLGHGRPGPPRVEPGGAERRVAAVEAAGLGEGWTDGDLGRGPSYRFRDPDGQRFELYYECERYDPPEHLPARAEERPGATSAAAARSSASTTSTSSPPTCAPTASSASTRSAIGCTSASSSTTAPRRGRG